MNVNINRAPSDASSAARVYNSSPQPQAGAINADTKPSTSDLQGSDGINNILLTSNSNGDAQIAALTDALNGCIKNINLAAKSIPSIMTNKNWGATLPAIEGSGVRLSSEVSFKLKAVFNFVTRASAANSKDPSTNNNVRDGLALLKRGMALFDKMDKLQGALPKLQRLSELSINVANKSNALVNEVADFSAQNYELSVEQAESIINKVLELVVCSENLDAQFEKFGINWQKELPEFFEKNQGYLESENEFVDSISSHKRRFENMKDKLSQGLDDKELIHSLLKMVNPSTTALNTLNSYFNSKGLNALEGVKPVDPIYYNAATMGGGIDEQGSNNGGIGANDSDSGIDDDLLGDTNNQNSGVQGSSSGYGEQPIPPDQYTYDDMFAGGKIKIDMSACTTQLIMSVKCVMLTVSVVTMNAMNSNYNAAAATATYVDTLNDVLACLSEFNSFLSSLNSFYIWDMSAVNEDTDDSNPVTTIDFDDPETAKYSEEKYHDGDDDPDNYDSGYYMKDMGDYNVLYMEIDDVPDAAIDNGYFTVDPETGDAMVTSDGIEDYLNYMSEMTSKVLSSSSGSTSLDEIYDGQIETSSQIQGVIDGINTTISQVNQLISNTTSTVSTMTNSAKSYLDLFNTLFNMWITVMQKLLGN
ncbi:MAG: hypothetical protein KBD37_06415 [Burkholderiales bacterium]|nr:hypothetical protein [Burkholderiales bacterium]